VAWSKRQLVEQAFDELALAGYSFDLTPEEMQSALRRLDAMLGTWAAQGIQVGYVFGSTPDDSDLDQDSGLPLTAVEAVYLGLAIRTAASKGKTLAPSTTRVAKMAYDSLLAKLEGDILQQQQYRSQMPKGAGNKPWRTTSNPFLAPPDTAPLRIGDDGGLEFVGE
jgi:hypothetical protein